jgi:hypothetical protein
MKISVAGPARLQVPGTANAEGLQGRPRGAGAQPLQAQARWSSAGADGGPGAGPDGSGTTRFSSAQLFGSAVEVEIEHRAQIYRLRRTALGKLILTK